MMSESTSLLMTGDKRLLRALANMSDLKHIHEKIRGRVICLELLIYKLIEVYSFEIILQRIMQDRERDITLKRCFGSGYQADKKTVLENLEKEIQEIQKDTKGILKEL